MGRFSEAKIDWSPFQIIAANEKPPYPRALSTREGVGDRLRFVAFAEKQAKHAFLMAAETYEIVPESVKQIWTLISKEEEKHQNWLLNRMRELEVPVEDRPVSLNLSRSFDRCETPRQFAEFMASSEEHGRLAGEKFYETLLPIDLKTANLFKQIALEEQEHIRLAKAILDHDFKLPKDFKIVLEALPESAYDEFLS